MIPGLLEHLFHPHHWTPLLAVFPLIPTLWAAWRARWKAPPAEETQS